MMHDCLEPPACMPSGQNDWEQRICEDPLNLDGSCCPDLEAWNRTNYAAVPFFVVYMLLSNFILLNVVIGIVLDNFAACTSDSEAGLSLDHFEVFEEVWYEFDVSRSRFLHVSLLTRFFRRLPVDPFRRIVGADDDNDLRSLIISERILLFNLHAPVIQGDVVSLSHVWISLYYLHHPDILPEDVMEKKLVQSYRRFNRVSGMNVNRYHSGVWTEPLFTDTLMSTLMIQFMYYRLVQRNPELRSPGLSMWYLTGTWDVGEEQWFQANSTCKPGQRKFRMALGEVDQKAGSAAPTTSSRGANDSKLPEWQKHFSTMSKALDTIKTGRAEYLKTECKLSEGEVSASARLSTSSTASDTPSMMLQRTRTEDLRHSLRTAKKRFVNVVVDAMVVAR